MVEIRPIAADELAAYLDAVAFGFGNDPRRGGHSPEHLQLVGEADGSEARMVATNGGGRIVATLGRRDFELTVPGGGTVGLAGTTQVTVHPQHRRQGILTRLISHHLRQARDEGCPLVGLWASEETIYGRFGYGHACPRFELTFSGAEVELPPGPPDVELRHLGPDEARTVLPPVYEQARLRVAGRLNRRPAWWELRHFAEPDHGGEGLTARRFALAERAGQPVGWVTYRQRYDRRRGGVPDGSVEVEDLVALDDGARRSLWHLIGHVDLYPRVVHTNCPVDEPALAEVARFRRLDGLVRDSLWLRPLDVPAALAARRYERDGTLVLRVLDGAGLAGGTWRLEVADGRGDCTPAPGGEPEVTMEVAELGALYLGGISARTLARAGRIEGADDAVRRLDQLFRTLDAPHTSDNF